MAKKDFIGTPAEPYWMNPEACAQLVEEHGSQAAAARAIGVKAGAFGTWLLPELAERNRASARRGYKRRTSEPGYYDGLLEKNRERYQIKRSDPAWLERERVRLSRLAKRPDQRERANRWKRMKRSSDPSFRSRERRRSTLSSARRRVRLARQQAEELYNG